MKDLPHWMQGCIVFCAFTGFWFWASVIGDLLKGFV